MIYNVEAAKENIYFTQNDYIPGLQIGVFENDVPFDMTGMQLDMTVRNDLGTAVKTWSSAGTSPKITINTTTFSIEDTGFSAIGVYKYDAQLTENGKPITFLRGRILVTEEYTT
jgi:hypothetical protein